MLSFVGAALLISVLKTDAQGPYVAAQVSYPRPEGYNSYSVGTYYGKPNPQNPPRQSSFFSDMMSTMSSVLGDSLNMMGDTFKKWFGVQSDQRPYPYYSQANHYSGPLPPPPPPPPASSHVVSAYPYNQFQPGNNQAGAPSSHYNGPPPPPRFVNSHVGASSNQYNDPSPPVASIQVTGASDSKNGPPPASSQLNVRMPLPHQNAM
ncbi:formin-like protein 3 isoform X2 [Crotalus tigris]|uniref:formin-like protein 3 isoform X2 n=1 Tax=Crotalus tigris TaxID=88082 RepID=UPI00192F7903|nr:formin-like protein 3 isoform X2 [Crotalus tigris]